MSDNTVIFAPAAPAGGAIAIVRISGAGAKELLRKFFIPFSQSDAEPKHRRMAYGSLVDLDGALIDACSAVYYMAPNSYTGEDMAEIFPHGSKAVLDKLFEAFSKCPGVRPAEPGEFTKRAFLNCKLDLSGAEAVMDMISASTELSRRAAAYQLEGGLRRRIDALYGELNDVASYIAAATDYPDEMEDEAIGEGELARRLSHVQRSLDTLIKNGLASRVLRDGASTDGSQEIALREGARVVIMGEPNSGKSSLLNALLMRDRAIVTNIAGTTRDTIEESADVNGIPVTFIDTAGIRPSADEVENLGIERAWRECKNADLVLWLHPAGEETAEYERRAFARLERPAIVVNTKADLCEGESRSADLPCENSISVSSLTGEGIDELRAAVASLLRPTDEPAAVTNTRHISALLAADGSINSAIEALGSGLGLDCCAADIADAMESIGSITGRTASEDIIDSIFSRFCVGK